jgi:hypothetical protein
MANCTGANAQYATPEDCTKAANALPAGTLGDTGGQDTLGCRQYHATLAAGAANAPTHCPHAGPFGGGGAGLTCGTAGQQCQAFCEIDVKVCTGADQVWADVAACKTACANFANNAALPYGVAVGIAYAKNDFNCRSYHLTAALTTPGTHCPHTGVQSATCNQ